MSEILEITMVICFGLSWPLNVYKSYKARTTKGKSILFLLFILIGYFAGIASKLTNESYMTSFGEKWYVVIFYFINTFMVLIDISLYVRNYRLDKLKNS